MGKKKNSLKEFVDRYNQRQTKGNVENTLLKGVVDTVAGSIVGTTIGSLTGDKAAFAGIALILAGHYIGDDSGLIRLTGASTMAYGIGKANEYRNDPNLNTPGKRVSALKDDWLAAFHLKWTTQAAGQNSKSTVDPTTESQKEKLVESSVVVPDWESSETDLPSVNGIEDESEEDFDLSLI